MPDTALCEGIKKTPTIGRGFLPGAELRSMSELRLDVYGFCLEEFFCEFCNLSRVVVSAAEYIQIHAIGLVCKVSGDQ